MRSRISWFQDAPHANMHKVNFLLPFSRLTISSASTHPSHRNLLGPTYLSVGDDSAAYAQDALLRAHARWDQKPHIEA